MRCVLLAATLLSLSSGVVAAAPGPSYSLTKTVALGAPDGRDYGVFDAAVGRVFIGHSMEVTVVDGQSGAILGRLQGLHGAHGTAVSPALNLAFAESGRGPASVTAYDLKTYRPIGGPISTPEDTDAIFYDPASEHVYTMNGDSGNASVIDPVQKTLITNIPLDGKA